MDKNNNENHVPAENTEEQKQVIVTPKQSSEEELDTEIEQFRADVAGDIEEESQPEPADSAKPKGPEYYLTDYIVDSYRNASPYLKQTLRGNVELSVSGQFHKVYTYTFADDARYAVGQATSESIVSADYQLIEGLIRGRVNAQIALLSKQIKVSGNVMKGMYFLNLLRSQRA